MNIVYAIYKMVFFQCDYECIIEYKDGHTEQRVVNGYGNRSRHKNLLVDSVPFHSNRGKENPYTTCVFFRAEYVPETVMIINCDSGLRDDKETNPEMDTIFIDDNIQNEVWKASEYSKSIKPSTHLFECFL